MLWPCSDSHCTHGTGPAFVPHQGQLASSACCQAKPGGDCEGRFLFNKEKAALGSRRGKQNFYRNIEPVRLAGESPAIALSKSAEEWTLTLPGQAFLGIQSHGHYPCPAETWARSGLGS